MGNPRPARHPRQDRRSVPSALDPQTPIELPEARSHSGNSHAHLGPCSFVGIGVQTVAVIVDPNEQARGCKSRPDVNP
jgi:hypothetical protein